MKLKNVMIPESVTLVYFVRMLKEKVFVKMFQIKESFVTKIKSVDLLLVAIRRLVNGLDHFLLEQ
jgi:hypothetical protein